MGKSILTGIAPTREKNLAVIDLENIRSIMLCRIFNYLRKIMEIFFDQHVSSKAVE
jgi:hypothetical protein